MVHSLHYYYKVPDVLGGATVYTAVVTSNTKYCGCLAFCTILSSQDQSKLLYTVVHCQYKLEDVYAKKVMHCHLTAHSKILISTSGLTKYYNSYSRSLYLYMAEGLHFSTCHPLFTKYSLLLLVFPCPNVSQINILMHFSSSCII